MKKLFISQPMNGKTKEEILAVREKAIESAEFMLNDSIKVIESYFEDYNPDDWCIPLKYLAKSLELLADADVAYFAEGFEEARGCRIEYMCARDYGIRMLVDSDSCPLPVIRDSLLKKVEQMKDDATETIASASNSIALAMDLEKYLTLQQLGIEKQGPICFGR